MDETKRYYDIIEPDDIDLTTAEGRLLMAAIVYIKDDLGGWAHGVEKIIDTLNQRADELFLKHADG